MSAAPTVLRALAVVPCLVLGVAVAICAVAVHDHLAGLALGLATTAAVLVALPRGWWARAPFALGWVGLVATVTPETTEGDLVVSNDLAGYVLLAAIVVVLAAGAASLVGPRRSSDAGRADAAP